MSFRCTGEEFETLRALADRAGVSVAAFCRSQVFGRKPPRSARHPTAAQTEVARLIAQLGQLADSLEQLKQPGNDPALLDAVARDLADIRVAAFRSMGRKP